MFVEPRKAVLLQTASTRFEQIQVDNKGRKISRTVILYKVCVRICEECVTNHISQQKRKKKTVKNFTLSLNSGRNLSSLTLGRRLTMLLFPAHMCRTLTIYICALITSFWEQHATRCTFISSFNDCRASAGPKKIKRFRGAKEIYTVSRNTCLYRKTINFHRTTCRPVYAVSMRVYYIYVVAVRLCSYMQMLPLNFMQQRFQGQHRIVASSPARKAHVFGVNICVHSHIYV